MTNPLTPRLDIRTFFYFFLVELYLQPILCFLGLYNGVRVLSQSRQGEMTMLELMENGGRENVGRITMYKQICLHIISYLVYLWLLKKN